MWTDKGGTYDGPECPGCRDRAARKAARPRRGAVPGYGLKGLPFASGHVLAMRRFPTSSIDPACTSVWHRDPAGPVSTRCGSRSQKQASPGDDHGGVRRHPGPQHHRRASPRPSVARAPCPGANGTCRGHGAARRPGRHGRAGTQRSGVRGKPQVDLADRKVIGPAGWPAVRPAGPRSARQARHGDLWIPSEESSPSAAPSSAIPRPNLPSLIMAQREPDNRRGYDTPPNGHFHAFVIGDLSPMTTRSALQPVT